MSLTKNFFWSAVERFSTQIIQFVIGILLARLLGPSEYGIISILMVINSFLQIFIDSGFSKALIQKKERTKLDYSSVYLFNIGIGIICYIILFLFSPLLETFYEIKNLSIYTRIVGISLVINTFYTVTQTDLIIRLDFKSIAKVNFISSLVSGLLAIWAAYLGFGVWALIIQILLKSFISLIIYQFFKKYDFGYNYSQASIRTLYRFGSNILYGSILNTLVNNFSTIFIAKMYNTQSLGFYTRGTQFTDVVYNTFSSILDNVLLPSFCQLSGDIEAIKNEFIKVYRYVVLLLWPIFLLLALLAEPIIRLLLTDKWLMSVQVMQLFAIARFISILSGLNISVLYSIGKSNLVLKQQILKILVRLILIGMALPFDIYYVALAELVSTGIHFFINTYYPGKILKVSGFKQLVATSKIFISSITIFVTTWIINYLFSNSLIIILLSLVLGLSTYIVSLKLLKVEELNYILNRKILKK